MTHCDRLLNHSRELGEGPSPSPLSTKATRAILFALPVITILLATWFQFSHQYQAGADGYGFFPLLITLTSLVSIFAIFLGEYILNLHRRINLLEGHENKYFQGKMDDLQKKVDLLSAVREMSIAVNEQTDFQTILTIVLHLLETVVSPREITIYLREDEYSPLRPVVRQRGHEVIFGEQVEADPASQDLARESLERRRNLRVQLADSLVLTHLLTADKETMGLIYVQLDPQDVTEEEADEVESHLKVLAKHVALAIRKPTLYDRAVLDGLTKLYTKRHFLQQAKKLFGMGQRLDKPFALILMDIDHFKSVNDTYGHLTGDIVLFEVAAVIRNSIREYDSAYRYGGEEIAILLPEANCQDAVGIAERIRSKVEAMEMEGEKKELIKVTCSAGVSAFAPYLQSFEDMVSLADQCLYKAKRGGRNQVRWNRENTDASAATPKRKTTRLMPNRLKHQG